MVPVTLIAFPGHAGRSWPLTGHWSTMSLTRASERQRLTWFAQALRAARETRAYGSVRPAG